MSHRRSPFIPFVVLAFAACAGDAAPTGGEGVGGADADEVALGAAVTVPPGAQAMSFLGDTLLPVEIPEATLEVYLRRYAEAEDDLARSPEDLDALIWMGRRTAYLGQFREAIDIYTYAMTLHPDDARLYRHRGHRYVSVRELDNAIADFRRAAELTAGEADEVEPDGLPNALNTPTSTLQFNIWYHMGLALYLKGDLAAALDAYRSCLSVSRHADSVVATSYWLYMTLRRLGRDAEAAEVLADISAEMPIIESISYLNLLRLWKGERTIEDLVGTGEEITLQSATTLYGVGVHHLLEGDEERAYETFERTRTGLASQWAAFGFIAAEAELARR